MKRIVALLLCVVLVALCCAGLSACSSREEKGASKSAIKLARNAKFNELTNSGMTKEEADHWLDTHPYDWHPDYVKQEKTESADETGPVNGHWELKGTETDPVSDASSESSSSRFSVTQTVHTFDYSYKDPEDVMNGETFDGSYAITCSDMPQSYNVGDTVSITLHGEVRSVTNQERVQDFRGKAEFQGGTAFPDLGFDTALWTCVGIDTTSSVPYFKSSEERTYSFTLDEKYAGKLKTFWVLFKSEAGESVWEYDWVND